MVACMLSSGSDPAMRTSRLVLSEAWHGVAECPAAAAANGIECRADRATVFALAWPSCFLRPDDKLKNNIVIVLD